MPARVRMPANNYMSTSATLQTHGIWKHTIKYDPHASEEEKRKELSREEDLKHGDDYNAQARSLFQLAASQMEGRGGHQPGYTPGACKHCGQVGHLAKQCMNLIDIDDLDDPNPKKSRTSLPVAPQPPLRVDEESSGDDESDDSEAEKRKKKRHHHHRRRDDSRSRSRSRDRRREKDRKKRNKSSHKSHRHHHSRS
ncbi:SREK1-interacting protein 1 [Perkinsus olseni]|uniref:SREK1-interacting protein 1 n=2 Tax=Perkinsus olseni TaxID=32597 RepID=A0A7J6SPX7_PEROL|nr:SREK1-interacting protein 1 [Perkinsus olseni]